MSDPKVRQTTQDAGLMIARIRDTLGLSTLTIQAHARHNLGGALHDIEVSNGQADEVSQRTIRRVIVQLQRVEEILDGQP